MFLQVSQPALSLSLSLAQLQQPRAQALALAPELQPQPQQPSVYTSAPPEPLYTAALGCTAPSLPATQVASLPSMPACTPPGYERCRSCGWFERRSARRRGVGCPVPLAGPDGSLLLVELGLKVDQLLLLDLLLLLLLLLLVEPLLL